MFFEEEFVIWADENPIEGIVEISKKAISMIEEGPDSEGWNEQELELVWEAVGLIKMIAEDNEIDLGFITSPKISGDISENCRSAMEFIRSIRDHYIKDVMSAKLESLQSNYKHILRKRFAYEFSEGDLNRIQSIINELRENLTTCSLSDEHKRRLMIRLENLQSELHKRVSDMDRFYGLLGDAGVVLGKLGTEAKPLVDRIKELASIVWNTQARAEELPSGTHNPMLENDSES
ncbi:hypothetical protein KQ940_13315 [Marinobacterium sp. D7]|uniref:hypothetical protein n=1 Tax=Marinobacterium ramblicola TaxID=2849041 RepID=UPI001C2DB071|nr:hypothetical protein [Marinobacterium ramblicola]MBV1789031.1 hypothetical protein [Marinobacterium ramblicola]